MSTDSLMFHGFGYARLDFPDSKRSCTRKLEQTTVIGLPKHSTIWNAAGISRKATSASLPLWTSNTTAWFASVKAKVPMRQSICSLTIYLMEQILFDVCSLLVLANRSAAVLPESMLLGLHRIESSIFPGFVQLRSCSCHHRVWHS